jgi:hypothetical protein
LETSNIREMHFLHVPSLCLPIMQKTCSRSPKSPDNDWQRVCECLFRYGPSGVYYAKFKQAGKQYKKSLKTKDQPRANRLTGFFDLRRKKAEFRPCRRD